MARLFSLLSAGVHSKTPQFLNDQPWGQCQRSKQFNQVRARIELVSLASFNVRVNIGGSSADGIDKLSGSLQALGMLEPTANTFTPDAIAAGSSRPLDSDEHNCSALRS
jgi:hypothetical protein